MSGRKIGGGRVLGSGKGILPPVVAAAALPPPVVGAQGPGAALAVNGAGKRAVSPFAPSESTLSLGNSSSSPSGSPGDMSRTGDLMASINLNGPSEASSNSRSRGTLLCPICQEEMVTLLQLNRHLDDTHQELPEVQQDEVKAWFNKQVLKAKRFQPLSMLNQKLRGLEVFESNESTPIHLPIAPTASGPRAAGTAATEDVIDPEELITRSHWQRSTSNDLCTDPACGKRLSPLNGSINCRGCGKLFCQEHTMYQMKLSRAAKHDPARGYWARVCETCYKSREGYNDHRGTERDHTAAFAKLRGQRVERQSLESARLEKRLTRLTRVLAEAPPEVVITPSTGSLLPPVPSFAAQKSPRKLIEQSVVAWEEDSSVSKCPFCQQEFGSWTFRRHHCRTCGRVVCADPDTKCSTEVGLSVAPPPPPPSSLGALEKPALAMSRPLAIDVRMCRDCDHAIFSHRDFIQSAQAKPPDQRAYETLRQFERGIRLLMPAFQKALLALQPDDDPDHPHHEFRPGRPPRPPPTRSQLQDAAKIRKRLVDAFAKYGAAAKRIRDLKTESPTQQALQVAIYNAASAFLHVHMLSLKSVPQMLRQRSQHQQQQHPHHHHLGQNSHLLPPPPSDADDTASQASDMSAALEAEEKELRERLVVLEEQRFLIGQMLVAARGERRFEEATALGKNADELDVEIGRVRLLVGGVEARWEGLFREGGPMTAG